MGRRQWRTPELEQGIQGREALSSQGLGGSEGVPSVCCLGILEGPFWVAGKTSPPKGQRRVHSCKLLR